MNILNIYTDGSCKSSDNSGGWAIYCPELNITICGNEKNTTNNIMELTAVIEGLKLLKYPCEVDLYSDSAYVVNAFLQGWIYNWVKNNWKTSGKEPVKNKEIWQELYNLTKIHKVNFIKVKGHSDNEFNNRCDELARNAIKAL